MCAPLAHAIPALQLYSPDAFYDTQTESWTISDDTFELWVIGAVGDYGTIFDVTLAASYYGSAGSTTVSPNLALDPNYASKPGFTNGVQNHDEFKNADLGGTVRKFGMPREKAAVTASRQQFM